MKAKRMDYRKRSLCLLLVAAALLAGVALAGLLCRDTALVTDFARKNLPPGAGHLFGTDSMGRDMLARTLAGLSLSMRIGLLTAGASALLALLLGVLAAAGRAADAAVSWLIDLVMGIPHMLLLVLVSFACGRGVRGVVLGVTLSHWMSLARVLRGEIMQLRTSGYVLAAGKLGLSGAQIVLRHMLPHLLPQFLVGLVLLFPHAVLHEAGITFLGFGLPPEQPAIGIILSEGVQHLSMGRWWLTVFPGLLLVGVVLLFHLAGGCLRRLTDPASAQD